MSKDNDHHNSTTKQYLAYLRVSTKKQIDEGGSMGEQREAIYKWCKAHGAEDE